MADVFRIEIPVEVTNKTDMGELQQLESLLGKIHSAMQRNSSAARGTFDAISSGAGQAGDALEQVAASAEEAAQGYQQAGSAAQKSGQTQESANEKAEQSSDKLGDTVEDVSESYEDVGESAQQAGNKSGSAFTQATGHVDKFSQRIEKTNQSLRKMFAQKFQMTLAAIDKISPTLRSVTTSVKNLTSKAWRVTVKIADMVTAPFRKLKQMIMSPIMMTLSLTGIGMGAGSFVSTFTDFVSGMSNVKALSGATEEEFSRLTETAEQLGATTKFTASEAAEGMQYLAMAGWKTNDIIAAMPGLLDLAAAGGTSLGTAADIVSDVMTAMSMASDQASRAADIFARTATGTNTTIENLGETLKYAAPIAHSFGLELSEVSTITGMMANAGVKGSMAGTAIRSSLLSMASPSKEAAEAMKKLNLQFADGSGKMKSMQAIVRDLSTAFKGLSEQEKLQYAEDIFGKYGSSAWLGVIEQGADAYDKLFESIDKSNGAAKEMANTQLDNLQGDVVKLQSAVDGMKISVMKQLDPYLRKGVQWLTGKIPDLTAKFTSFITTGIGKAKELKNFLQDVFNSSDFQNAEGFAGKFFVAWDKIIAEPFSNWWEGNGRQTVLGAVEKVGSGMGEMYHGIISGIFAALKGEEIDFEGLNLTGLGKAGAEAAKTFIESFKDSFDLGGLFDEAPGLLKAGLFGFGALKIGGGALGIVKTIGSIRMAFGKIPAAAAAATAATDAVGSSTVTAAAGAGKLASMLGIVKTGLSAIPVWGWVAAAAIAAVVAGVVLYNEAQERERQSILHLGDSVEASAQKFKDTAAQVNEALDTIEQVKTIQLKIEENKGGNSEVIEEFKKEVEEIQNREVWIIAKLAQNTLTPEEIAAYQAELEQVKGQIADVEAKLSSKTLTAEQAAAYQAELEQVKGRKAEVEAALSASTLTEEQVTAYQSELEALKGQKAEIMAALASGTLTAEQVLSYQAELEQVKGQKAEVEAALASGTLTEAQVKEYQSKLEALTGKEAELNAKLADSSLTPEQVAAYQGQLEALKGKEAEINAKLAANSLTAQQVLDYQAELDALKGKEAELSAALASGTLTASDVASYQAELEALKGKKAELEAALASGTLTKSDIDAYQKELDSLHGNTVELVVSLSAEGYNQATVQAITEQLNAIQEGQKTVTLILADKTELTPTQISNYVTQLTSLAAQKTTYELMIEGAGLGPDEIKARKDALAEIESKKADLEVQIKRGQEGMTDQEWSDLVSEYNTLTTKAGVIEMTLKGSELNENEVSEVKKKLEEVKGQASGITLKIAYAEGSELSQSDLNKIAETLGQIGDVEAMITIGLSDGSLGPKDIEDAAAALETMYKRLAEMSGGAFTAEELQSGAASVEQVQEILQKRSDVELAQLQNDVEAARRKRDAGVSAREGYGTQVNNAQANIDTASAAMVELVGINQDVELLNTQRQGKLAALRANEMSYDDYANWEWGTYYAGIEAAKKRYNEGILPNLVDHEGYAFDGIYGELSDFDLTEGGGVQYLIDALSEYVKGQTQERDKYKADYDTQDESLVKLYQGEKALIEGQSFNGTDLAGYSIEEAAANYYKLDEAGRQAFDTAAAGLADINEKATYITEEQKTTIESVITTAYTSVTGAASQSVIDDISAKISGIKAKFAEWDNAPAEETAAAIESVNAALDALGIKDFDVKSMEDLQAAIDKINGIDPSKLELDPSSIDSVSSALGKLGGDANAARAKLEEAKQKADALAGTYNVVVKYSTEGTPPKAPDQNAYGGIYDGAFLSWVAEDGPEAIIPLGADKRGRGLDLWMQAGEMLGVSEFADGGIMAPYSGLLDDIPDDIWDDDEPKKPQPEPHSGNQGGGNTVHVSVSASPVFQIDGGGSPDEVISVIMDNVPMLAEVFGAAIADKMEDIVTNLQ